MISKIFMTLLIAVIIFLTSCSSQEPLKQDMQFFVVSEDGMEESFLLSEIMALKAENSFEVGLGDGSGNWYQESTDRIRFLRQFRGIFEQKKEDFEAEKRSQFKHVRAVIDSEMIIGYKEALDLDKTYEESLTEPDVKSDSIYATQDGRSAGFPVEG